MARAIIELLEKGRQANLSDQCRRGNLIYLAGPGRLVVTGDLHGHRRNFERICVFADLANNPDSHVVLQEIIHGGPADSEGGCLSFELLFEVVDYKLQFPDRVHIIMGNHDTAVINQGSVMKDGKEMNRPFRRALRRCYGADSEAAELALRQLLFSQPLAVKSYNRLWVSHSLPSDNYLDKFDCGIFDRPLKINEPVRPGSVYLLTWGRRHSQKTLDKLAGLLDVDVFILGHQPQEKGFRVAGANLLILACDHNHGVLLPVDLREAYTVERLVEAIVPLASIA
jgi:hypothetical protein